MENSRFKLIELTDFSDERGGLVVAEWQKELPFKAERIYVIHSPAEGTVRGNHGHKELEQVFIALQGSFDLTVWDAHTQHTVTLNTPKQALYVPKQAWRTLNNFSDDAICLVIASQQYNAADYVHTAEDFKTYLKENS
jgi:dTDP-4-dehydrorhamnose 3,5-epimerase-like enzyme